MVVRVYIGCLPLKSCDWLGAMAPWPHPASRESILLQIASLGKDQNLKYSFYWICIAFTYGKVEKSVSATILSGQTIAYCRIMNEWKINGKKKIHALRGKSFDVRKI